MHNFSLRKTHALNGYVETVNGINICELTDIEIFALAIPIGKERTAKTSFKKYFNCGMPDVGKLEAIHKNQMHILRMSNDQLFAINKSSSKSEFKKIFIGLGAKFYITEQTDSWVGLKVGGNRINECLERICMIDISIEKFGVNNFARTMMEHMGVIILRTKDHEFEIFSASSSIKSFLHAITTSAKNI